MPELPEVETIRHDLAAVLSGRRLSSVKILFSKTASHGAVFLERELTGRRILGVDRRGKLLIFRLNNSQKNSVKDKSLDFLLIHLKMTGQLIYSSQKLTLAGGHSLTKSKSSKRPAPASPLAAAVGGNLPNKHTRAIFSFDSGAHLFFNDLRKFGYLKLCSKLELDRLIAANYGPEPLTPAFTFSALSQILKNKKTKIKAVLLDQKRVAGLGNIYVDESLFAAQIRPERLAASLSAAEVKKLWQAIQKIIKLAISKRGTTFSDYRDSEGRKGNFSRYLKVYGRNGQKCLRCGQPILKVKLAGRGTHYCANCQK